MLFKRLEISGFKSFAKNTVLEFPSDIISIVGPNGSGKSNVADSIRWVLGEQSMKSLRGKRGEDLIFAGTELVPRMGKASVDLVFDNKKNQFKLEFDEVIVGRRVYRDGINEYTLNGSPVRLKDIIELLSKIGLGASQHHIIAQGDADRILYASSSERKSMISDALGLRIFEFKKVEAQRKIEHTKENIKDAELLQRELAPHLKYLRTQSEKAKGVSELKELLEQLSKEFVRREIKTINEEENSFKKEKTPILEKIKTLEEIFKKSESVFQKEGGEDIFSELKKLDVARNAIFEKRRRLDFELAHAEARKEKGEVTDGVMPKSKFKEILLDLVSDLESATRSGSIEAVRNIIFSSTQKIYRVLESINVGPEKNTKNNEGNIEEIKSAVKKLEDEEKNIVLSRLALEEEYRKKNIESQKEASLYRQRSEEVAKAKEILNSIAFREERLKSRKKDLEIDFGSFLKTESPKGELLSIAERDDMRKKIERMRIRLEEAGGVDENVVKECEDTEKRFTFLEGELSDLKKTAKALEELFWDLDKQLEKDFKNGISKINSLFGTFFNEIFGGGKAEIKLIEPQKAKKAVDPQTGEEEEIEETEGGIDIVVNIPRKRIKSLNMLSGGERALTSIALLFAVSTVNPPPFLVLDETDAALDEANSRRYSNMLKELGKKTQLIVITHNRETMRSADVLYGVTMGRDGVSSLLSIKFEEAEDLVKK